MKNNDIFYRRFLWLRSTEHFHIMVDIPEKMIDNSKYINQSTVLQVGKNPYQIERKAVGVNKHNSFAVDKE